MSMFRGDAVNLVLVITGVLILLAIAIVIGIVLKIDLSVSKLR